MSLYERNRGTARFQDNGDRLIVERIGLLCTAAARTLARQFTELFRTAEDSLDVLRFAHLLQLIHHTVDLLVTHKRSMHALRQTCPRGQIEHVALAQKRFRTHLIENSA